MLAINILAACVLDGILGDPRGMPHPVRMIGRVISWIEHLGRTIFSTQIGQRVMGIVIGLVIPGGSFFVGWALLNVATVVHPWFADLLWVFLAYTTLAAKDLARHALVVSCYLQAGLLPEARKAVSLIVGRDTEELSESEVTRATVETVAESTSDGVIAPLFYLVLGGPPLALAYKAINTLDSMIGHHDPPYQDIGWASAKLDDVVNWIPARLSALLLVLSSGIRLKTSGHAWRIYRRDCSNHASPNSGHPEAAMAGALGVQLGGPNVYDGIVVDRLQLGDPTKLLQPQQISLALDLMWISFGLAIFLGVSITILWNSI